MAVGEHGTGVGATGGDPDDTGEGALTVEVEHGLGRAGVEEGVDAELALAPFAPAAGLGVAGDDAGRGAEAVDLRRPGERGGLGPSRRQGQQAEGQEQGEHPAEGRVRDVRGLGVVSCMSDLTGPAGSRLHPQAGGSQPASVRAAAVASTRPVSPAIQCRRHSSS